MDKQIVSATIVTSEQFQNKCFEIVKEYTERHLENAYGKDPWLEERQNERSCSETDIPKAVPNLSRHARLTQDPGSQNGARNQIKNITVFISRRL